MHGDYHVVMAYLNVVDKAFYRYFPEGVLSGAE